MHRLIPYTTAASDDESIDLDLRTHSYVSNFALLYKLSVISYTFVIEVRNVNSLDLRVGLHIDPGCYSRRNSLPRKTKIEYARAFMILINEKRRLFIEKSEVIRTSKGNLVSGRIPGDCLSGFTWHLPGFQLENA